jgi:hypothetical protein
MRCKRNLTTNEVVKHKARLNLHGGKQVFGMNYFKTYAPVVTWFAIRLILVMAIYLSLALRQVDFVQAYLQAPLQFDMYMELPQGIVTRHGNAKDHVLQLLSNIYGQKQAGRVWKGYLVEKLTDIGFKPSLIDECVFYHGNVIFILYVDDSIFVGDNDDKLTQSIRDIQQTGLAIADQEHPADYIGGVSIKKQKDGSYELFQRALIDSIIEDCELEDAYTKPVPAKVDLQLHAYKSSKPFDKCGFPFNYRSITWDKLPDLTSCSQYTRLQSMLPTQTRAW